MFSKFLTWIKPSFKSPVTPPDPSRFDNPVALRTSWSPLKSGGTNFRTHNYVEERDEVRFQPTMGALIFCGFFISFGALFALIAFSSMHQTNEPFQLEVLLPILIPLIFSGGGIFMFRLLTTPIVFNKHKGYYWKGRVNENQRIAQADLKVKCKLTEIEAVQVIAEWISGHSSGSSGGSSYYQSYEINLVLKDASRLNVVDYGHYRGVVESAQKLSHYLSIPLWDATR